MVASKMGRIKGLSSHPYSLTDRMVYSNGDVNVQLPSLEEGIKDQDGKPIFTWEGNELEIYYTLIHFKRYNGIENFISGYQMRFKMGSFSQFNLELCAMDIGELNKIKTKKGRENYDKRRLEMLERFILGKTKKIKKKGYPVSNNSPIYLKDDIICRI